MNRILGKTRSEWADFMFANLRVDEVQVGPVFSALLAEVQECRPGHDESVKGHCESAIAMANELHTRYQSEVSSLGMSTALVEGLVHLHKGIVLMERGEAGAGECFEQCLEVLPQRWYPWERTIALVGHGLLQQCKGSRKGVEDAMNTFQRAKASAVQIKDPSVRAVLGNEVDGLIEQALKGLLKPKHVPPPTGPRKRPFTQTSVNAFLLPIGSPASGGKPKTVDPSDMFRGYVEVKNVIIDGEEYRFVDILDKGHINLTVHQQEHFAAQVNGPSMKDAGIQDGDYVVVKVRKSVPDNGDIVATAVEDTDRKVNLKRCKIENGGCSLVAENRDQDFPPQYFTSKNPPPDFIGIAIAVLKRVVT